VRSGEDRDEGIEELLGRGVADGLLRDVNVCSDSFEEPEAAEPQPDGC